jgi:predicted nuclease of restriction endonuclease-like (RecB) superfamily
MTSLIIDKDYATLLTDLKAAVKSAQLKAHRAVNTELITLYWTIGKNLLERQKVEQWGSKYLEQVSKDLKAEFPGMTGLSAVNLKRMRMFSSIFPTEIGSQAVTQLPWGHLIEILFKNKTIEPIEWYAQQAIENGWSRNVLTLMMKQNLYQRQSEAPKITNFKNTLPALQSDLANEMLKDPYSFEFLTLSKPASERAIENALILQIRDFLLELGQGFAFVGNQYHLDVGGDDFYIDCLFYNIKMRAYVVIELKSGKFKPEYAGQLNFYLTAIDRQLKVSEDNPTVGILLCESKNKVVAQYAVDGMVKPMGISEYELSKALSQRLQTCRAEQAETEIEIEVS